MELKNRANPAVGMTLIELIVALALGAILMVVLMSITRQSIRSRDAARAIASQIPDTSSLVEQLQRDFGQADSIRMMPGGVLLAGAIQRDTESLATNHRDALVRYRVAYPSADLASGWLVRDQWRFDAESGRLIDQSSQPVWRGVVRLELSSTLIGGLPGEQAFQDEWILGSQPPPHAMPPSVRARLIGPATTGRPHVLLDQTFFNHWEG